MKWPDAVPFDPFAGIASPAVEALLEGPGSAGPVLLLAVGPLAQRGGWAAATAIALAEAFAARGENVILADLSLRNPELHALVGLDNDEGLTDVFLFGASLQHTARAVPGKQLRLIPASVFTPDPAEVLQHKHWSAVFEELAAQQSKLVAYLPMDLEGAHALSDRVGHTVVLADPFDLDDVRAVLSEDADVISVLLPPDRERADAAAAEVETPVVEEAVEEVVAEPPARVPMERLDDAAFEKIRIPKDGARDALIADLRNRQRNALMSPPPAMTPLSEGPAEVRQPRSDEPVRRAAAPRSAAAPVTPLFTMRVQPAPKKRGWLLALLIVSLLVAASAGGWYWWQSRPAPKKPVSAAPARPVVQAPQRIVPPALTGSKLPFSVAIASYQELKTAEDQRDQLARGAAGLSFYVAPIELQSKTFYRVMAGPVPDSASAATLRDTLIAKRIKTISTGSDVVSTPYAFLVGEFASKGDAELKQREAATKGIPSYVVALTGDDGSITYRLYAGAFTGPGDADFMHRILKSAGLPDTLVERTGST